jgi:hypothetical protein
VELLLNLIWLALSVTAVVSWILWRRSSSSEASPQMVRGLLVVVCILALLFPVISISDDLSQVPSLAEGNRLQDVLKSPELRGIYVVCAVLPAIWLLLHTEPRLVVRNFAAEIPADLNNLFWTPSVDKRPPPQFA